MINEDILKKLYSLQDIKYRDFQGKLLPTVDPGTIIGVRTPALRKLAKELAKQDDAIIPYIEQKKLDPWTHSKAIQKAVESYRITPEQKEYLRTFRLQKSL